MLIIAKECEWNECLDYFGNPDVKDKMAQMGLRIVEIDHEDHMVRIKSLDKKLYDELDEWIMQADADIQSVIREMKCD